MIAGNSYRDEEAVSAAVATVLLFGGVVTIIGIMLLSMMPVIQELEGSLKRNDMQSQMEIMGHEITLLSESGVPGEDSDAARSAEPRDSRERVRNAHRTFRARRHVTRVVSSMSSGPPGCETENVARGLFPKIEREISAHRHSRLRRLA